MKTTHYLLLLPVAVVLWVGCAESNAKPIPDEKPAKTVESDEDRIKQGEYLTMLMGCDHCHTPKKWTDQGPVPDMERWLMGYPSEQPLPEIVEEAVGPGKWMLMNGDLTAAVGPWGVSFAANLTPHETGMGNWNFDNFKNAMQHGWYRGTEGTRKLNPPMPWQSFAHVKEADLKLIFEYLQSIQPIDNRVPDWIPPGGGA